MKNLIQYPLNQEIQKHMCINEIFSSVEVVSCNEISKFKKDNSKLVIDLRFQGPFLILTQFSSYLFIPNFTVTTSNNDKKRITLLNSINNKTFGTFVFKDLECANDFYMLFSDINNYFFKLIPNINFNFCLFSKILGVLIANSAAFTKFKVSTKIDESKKKPIIELDPQIFFKPKTQFSFYNEKIYINHVFEEDFNKNRTQIKFMSNGQTYIIQCNDHSESINVIYSIFILSKKREFSQPNSKSLPVLLTEIDTLQDMRNPKSSDDNDFVFSLSQSGEASIDPQQENPRQSQYQGMRRRGDLTSSNNNDDDDDQDATDAESSNKIYQSAMSLLETFEGSREEFQANKLKESTLHPENFFGLHEQIETDFASVSEFSSESNLNAALKNLSREKGEFVSPHKFNMKSLDTDSIVSKTIDSLNEGMDDKSYMEVVNTFFDFRDFDKYQDLYVKSSAPSQHFISELRLEKKKFKTTSTVYSAVNFERFISLITALFLNGFDGFDNKSFPNTKKYRICMPFLNFISSFDIAVSNGFYAVLLDMANLEENKDSSSDLASLASTFTVLLLNSGLLIHFLRTVRKNSEIVRQYYASTSYLQTEILDISISVLEEIFLKTVFDISVESASSILNKQSQEFIECFIKTPAHVYLEMRSYSLELAKKKKKPPAPIVASNSPSALLKKAFSSSDFTQLLLNEPAFNQAIIHQFELGIRNGLKAIDFICKVKEVNEKIFIDGKNSEQWTSFADAVEKAKSDAYPVCCFVKEGLDHFHLHYWLLFLASDAEIAESYYYPTSIFVDHFSMKFTINAIYKYHQGPID